MQFEMAPMEGLTNYIFRNAYVHNYGSIEKFYTPFISLHKDKEFNSKELREIDTTNNQGILLVPQVLTNSAYDFVKAAKQLQSLGFNEVNLNCGCPSATVTPKQKGAGMLKDVSRLDHFLDEIFTKSDIKISIKTRIGIQSEDEWEPLLHVYRKYPIEELIIHTRVCEDFYKYPTRPHTFAVAERLCSFRLCYNGDVFSEQSYQDLLSQNPGINRVMLGRGIVRKPWLVEQLAHPEQVQSERDRMRTLRSFHDEILEEYRSLNCGDKNVLFRMKELWSELILGLNGAEAYAKKVKKTTSISEYNTHVNDIFENCTCI